MASSAAPAPSSTSLGSQSEKSAPAARLEALREQMKAADVDALWVGSGDPYLNEYVPIDESLRAYLSGFTGSMGDILITRDRALLIVDGRYRLQASQEAPDFETTVVPLGTTITEGWLQKLRELAAQGVQTIGVESERTPCGVFQAVRRKAAACGLQVRLLDDSLVMRVRRARKELPKAQTGKLRPCPPAISGTVAARLAAAKERIVADNITGHLVVALDALAWIVNARGDYFAFQATFPGRGLVLNDRVLLELHDKRKTTKDRLAVALSAQEFDWSAVELVDDLSAAVKSLVDNAEGEVRIGYDPGSCTEAARAAIENAGAKTVAKASPFFLARTQKSASELAHMVEGFHRADVVVTKLQSWLSGAVSRGEHITEADVSTKLKRLYKRSGAAGLSFRPICGADAHGAIIHYGTPDAKAPIKEGALFLCDSGAFYEGGYATDLTRTFVVGKSHVKPSARQQRLFTLVLKGAIAGMRARVPKGTSGEAIDAIIRAPMWAAGLNYAHGTGHGVGVNVHEFPPRIAPRAPTPVLEGQVFSIEPGVYLDGELGIRIENLCTVEEDKDDPGFLRVRPLTFAALDKRLIDRSLLTKGERAFLQWFDGVRKAQKQNPTAPLTSDLPPLEP